MGRGVHNSKCSSMTEQRSKGVQASEGKGGRGRGREGKEGRTGKARAWQAGKTRPEGKDKKGGAERERERDSASNMMLLWVLYKGRNH